MAILYNERYQYHVFRIIIVVNVKIILNEIIKRKKNEFFFFFTPNLLSWRRSKYFLSTRISHFYLSINKRIVASKNKKNLEACL